MALQKQKMDVPFVTGLNNEPHPHRISVPKMLRADNVSLNKEPGAMTKRRGWEELVTAGAMTVQNTPTPTSGWSSIFTFGARKMALGNDGKMYEWIESLQALSEEVTDAFTATVRSQDTDFAPFPLAITDIGQGADYALNGAYEMITYAILTDGDPAASLFVEVRELLTGSVVLRAGPETDVKYANQRNHFVVASGDFLGLFVCTANLNIISVVWFDVTNPPTSLDLVDLTGASPVLSTGIGFHGIFEDDAGAPGVTFVWQEGLGLVTLAHVAAGATTTTTDLAVPGPHTNDGPFHLFKHSTGQTRLDFTWLMYESASDELSVRRILDYVNQATAIVFPSAPGWRRITIVEAPPTATTVRTEAFFIESNEGSALQGIFWRVLELDTLADPPNGNENKGILGHSLVSAGFRYMPWDKAMIHVNTDWQQKDGAADGEMDYVPHTATMELMILLRTENDPQGDRCTIVGWTYYEQAAPGYGRAKVGGYGFITTEFGTIAKMSAWRTASVESFVPNAQLGQIVPTVHSTTFNAGGDAIEVNGTVVLPGGAIYTGGDLQNIGFPYRPVIVGHTVAGGGSLTQSTQYQWAVSARFVDRSGNVQESAPSNPLTVLLGVGETQVTLAIRPIMDRSVTAELVVYRTQANGSVLQRLNQTFDTNESNIRFNAVLSVIDGAADVAIASNAILYTTGNAQLPNHPPPHGAQLAFWQNRMWVIDESENVGSLAHSKEIIVGQGLAFHPFLSVDTASRTPPVAIVNTDTELLVLARNHVAVVQGEGPDPRGLSSTYSTPQVIGASPVGCSEARSVVRTPAGVFFYSRDQGIYVYAGGVPQFVGAPLRGILLPPTLADAFEGEGFAGANLIHDQEEVRFQMSTGEFYVWNTSFGAWSRSVLPLGALPSTRISDTTLWTRNTVCDLDGNIWRELPPGDTTYLDDTGAFEMDAETGWFTFDNIQGIARIWNIYITGERGADTVVTVEVYTDFDDVAFDLFTFEAPGAAQTTMELRCHLRTQRVKAMKLRMRSSQAATTDIEFKLTGLRLEVGIYQRAVELNRANNVR